MTQQNEVQQAIREDLEETIDTMRTALSMKENRVTQLEVEIAAITKRANKTIAELQQKLEDQEKDFDLAELNGKGELAEVTS